MYVQKYTANLTKWRTSFGLLCMPSKYMLCETWWRTRARQKPLCFHFQLCVAIWCGIKRAKKNKLTPKTRIHSTEMGGGGEAEHTRELDKKEEKAPCRTEHIVIKYWQREEMCEGREGRRQEEEALSSPQRDGCPPWQSINQRPCTQRGEVCTQTPYRTAVCIPLSVTRMTFLFTSCHLVCWQMEKCFFFLRR